VRSQVAINEAQLAALKALESYDLTPVRDRLIRRTGMLPRWAGEAIYEFRRYLALRLLINRPINMLSGDVDEVWHTCLLFTRLYADLCQQVFGHFVHHDPELDDNMNRAAAWREFEETYQVYYGDLTTVWYVWRPLGQAETLRPVLDVEARS
jgi:hypothetical protein